MMKETGVRCPHCCGVNQKVIDSRPAPNGWKRRRRACQCGERFSTIEIALPDEAEGTSKLAVGINIIMYAMSFLKEHEAMSYRNNLVHLAQNMREAKKKKSAA